MYKGTVFANYFPPTSSNVTYKVYLITVYCKATIFSELLNLAKLAMTHETLNLLALNVRSKVTLYSSKSI